MAEESLTRDKPVQHVAIIMDGNRRWAEKHGKATIHGHRAGAEAVRRTMHAARDNGIRYLTLYAFSMENWQRPQYEVNALMQLLREFIRRNLAEMKSEGIRLRAIGRLEKLPKLTRKALEQALEETASNSEFELIIAISYSGRAEIVDAARNLVKRVQSGDMELTDIDEDSFSAALYAPDLPDPDFLIRSSGEYRLSNFLLWQLSYSEFIIQDVLWPDYDAEHFAEALRIFKYRNRRFGRR